MTMDLELQRVASARVGHQHALAMKSLTRSPVFDHMRSPVSVVREDDRLAIVEEELARLDLSALPVTDRRGAMIGVISRSDLLRVGRVRTIDGPRSRALALPEGRARDFMSPTVEVVSPQVSLAEVARRLVRQHIHRVYVSEQRRLLGVVGTKEVMQAVANVRVATPIGELMHGSVESLHAADSVALAIERLAASKHRSLVVLEDSWPVGLFTQADALAARDAPASDPLDQWMDARITCLPIAMPAFRAAQQIAATRARAALAVDAAGLRGIVTGMDYAGFIMNEASRPVAGD